jgi:hypothetical protein
VEPGAGDAKQPEAVASLGATIEVMDLQQRVQARVEEATQVVEDPWTRPGVVAPGDRGCAAKEASVQLVQDSHVRSSFPKRA